MAQDTVRIYTIQISLTDDEMDQARSFERLLDAKLALARRAMMAEFERRRPHPPECWHWPKEEKP